MGKYKNNKKSKSNAKKEDQEIDALLNAHIAENKKSLDANNVSLPTHCSQNPKKANKRNNKEKYAKYANYPNVSICTPTFNRRPFFEGLISCIKAQDYPHYKIEWIIVDDGTDCVRDIFESASFIEEMGDIKVRYFYESDKMDLGKKRNYMHSRCTYTRDEDIIVYMDDDDYYPPERVSHSVERLMSNPNALCGGSSEIYLWFNDPLNKMYKFGPYNKNHATAGTFAFRRRLLKDTSYEDDAVLAEEKHFLKDYTIPFVQFDPLKTILVFSHEQNTFDKRRLINAQNKFCNESHLKVSNFIKNKDIEKFYKEDISERLKEYTDGDVKNKPKVLNEIARRDKERADMANNRPSGVVLRAGPNGEEKQLSVKELNDLMHRLLQENKFLKNKVQELMNDNTKLKQEINNYQLLKGGEERET